MPLLVHAMSRAFGMHRAAIHHARLADREVGDVDHFLHFTVAFGLDLASLKCDQVAKRVFMFSERIGDIAHRFATNGSRDVPPHREGFLRHCNHLFVFGL